MAQRSLRPAPLPDDEPAPSLPATVHPIHPKKRPNQSGSANRRTAAKPEPVSTLWYGDNLQVLREHVPDESVDLVYLDPPFNSNRAYNVIFRGPKGIDSASQIQAFDDTWTWTDATNVALADLARANVRVHALVDALVRSIGQNDLTAYLVMMALRLVELHRVMKPTASLYLHCDPTASHYLKIVLDALFGPTNFRNEIVWKRTTAHSGSKKFAPVHDTLLYYGRSDRATWNDPRLGYDQAYLDKYYRFDDGDGRLYWRADLCAAGVRNGRSGVPWRGRDPAAKGMHWKYTVEKLDELDAEGRIYWPKNGGMPQYKRYRDELKGKAVPDIWDDIDRINPVGGERTGYATQKPIALLERIIEASSDPGDLVLDPFCGCGTAVVASESLGRRWIGIDITALAIGVIEKRFDQLFEAAEFAVKGVPESADDAADLARRDPFQFQWWAAGRIGAMPHDGRNRKGPDKGIDGIIPFFDDPSGRAKRAIVSVKSGRNINAEDIRALEGTVHANKAEAGVFLTLFPPTSKMRAAAAQAGLYSSPLGHDYPLIQILTVDDILADKLPDLPDQESQRRRRRRIATQRAEQQRLPEWG